MLKYGKQVYLKNVIYICMYVCIISLIQIVKLDISYICQKAPQVIGRLIDQNWNTIYEHIGKELLINKGIFYPMVNLYMYLNLTFLS